MKEKCCDCKHICQNPKFDEILDCELALEETGQEKCCDHGFDKFEFETSTKARIEYKELWKQQNK